MAPTPPPRGTLLAPKELSALYDLLEATQRALRQLGVPWLLVAGSLLGAARSRSLLFCDDDVDLAVFERDYPRVRAALPALLAGVGTYALRPWPGADHIRPLAQTQVSMCIPPVSEEFEHAGR